MRLAIGSEPRRRHSPSLKCFLLRGHILVAMVTARLVATAAAVASASAASSSSSSSSTAGQHNYTRYPAYPDYCSTPAQMSQRTVPPLRDDVPVGETRLVHVTAVVRHGARTPLLDKGPCWDGFSNTRWNCDMQMWMATPPPRHVREEEDQSPGGSSQAMFLFEKKYDALTRPDGSVANKLNGTCQYGQLTVLGYDQMIRTGAILKDAYLYDKDNTEGHDIRMRLMPQNSYPLPSQIRYRADDDERSLLSGQALLRGMLGPHTSDKGAYPVIALHTSDLNRDNLQENTEICPRLQELEQEAKESKEYKTLDQSDEGRVLRNLMTNELGQELEDPHFCLMSAICNDMDLPRVISDFRDPGKPTPPSRKYDGPYGKYRFQRLVTWDANKQLVLASYNDAAHSKLASGPLWAEILKHMKDPTETEHGDDASILRFSLFAGHSFAIVPLLASLGYNVFSTDNLAFAGTLLIEVHELVGGTVDRTMFKSNKAFRLLYNGRVLTSHVDGCSPDADLCDVSKLVEQVQSFATPKRDCAATKAPPKADNPTQQSLQELKAKTTNLLVTPGGIFLVAVVMLLSAFVGGVVTWWYLVRRSPFRFSQVETNDFDDEY